MTVVAWDGKTLAADRLSNGGGTCYTMTKVARLRGHLVGGAGCAADVRSYMRWFDEGAHPADFPAVARAGNITLLVITPAGKVLSFESGPEPLEMEGDYYAIGSGGDFALAAMHLGHDAVTAVKTANFLSTTCGRGWDTLTLED